MKLLLGVLLALTMSSLTNSQKQTADVIFVNGNVYTGALHMQGAHALAISGDKIISVGSDEDIRKLKGPHTQTIDLVGHFVMPGFNDAHTHLASAGFEKLNVNLVGAKSLEEMQRRIAEKAKTASPGEWVLGEGWDHTLWASQKLPTRQDVDAVTAGHPAIFTRVDGHIAIANTAALQAGGVTAQTPDPQGGKIDRGDKGEATGILRETAQGLVRTKIPKLTSDQRRRALELALADAAQWGITSAQDFSEWQDFLVLEQMEREGKLTLRVAEWLPFDQPVAELKQEHEHRADAMLRTTMLKGFMDGSLGSRTAAMLAPYSDDPGNSGLPRYDQDTLNKKAAERAQAGFQLGFHAIGDRGTRMALEAFEYAEQHSPAGSKDFRYRIEHAQVVAPEDFKKFKDLGVIASMQPNHLLTDMNWAEAHIGTARARHSYAWKEFLDLGVPLCFGTDYPVEPITPLRGLYAAVTRKNEAGTKEYFPEQKITIAQAIAAYTTGAAYAEFEEKQKGTLVSGMLADFVVLDRDLTKVAPEEILRTRVLRTVVGGRTVYEAK
ncbi:MAG TPA: amidohydrolase [Candidatus Angelobacter sp.]|nr:amidohydrolase [Candidatus Angelobacter sp.]